MRFPHFFIDRPIFAVVLSTFVTIVGLGCLLILPVAQYPEIVPPTVQITTVYPGASAETVSQDCGDASRTGNQRRREHALYEQPNRPAMEKLTITVTFRLGTDLNVAQMLTQNRVDNALSRLPDDVQRQGVEVRKSTPDILLAVHIYSPDRSRDVLYLSNYATLHIKDALARLPGVGDVQYLGAREYAMRIWLEPRQGRLAQYERRGNTRRPPGAESPGVGRHSQPDASRLAPGIPAECRDTRASDDTQAI